jgi:hypothetical protein
MDNIHERWEIIPIILFLAILGAFISFYIGNSQVIKWLSLGIFEIVVFMSNPRVDKHLKLNPNGITLLILIIPLVVSMFFSTDSTVASLLYNSTFTFVTSLSIVFLFMKNKDKGTVAIMIILTFIMVLISTYKPYFYGIMHVFGMLVQYIASDMGAFISCSIAFVVLCATLSLLALTYILTLNNGKDVNYLDLMKKNGEDFFIATLLAVISSIFIILLSIISKVNLSVFTDSIFNQSLNTTTSTLNFSTNFNTNITPSISVNIFIFIFFTILNIIVMSYGIIYLVRGIHNTLKQLNLNWKAGF